MPDHPRKRRRAVTRTPKLEQAVLERVAAGESLRKACRDPGMPDESAVRYWAVHHPDFGERLKRARMVAAHAIVDMMTEELAREADYVTEHSGSNGKRRVRVDAGEVQLRRLKIDTWKWVLSKMLPKLYGERLALEHAGGMRIDVVTGVPRERTAE
jgi:hypothetical protein